MVSGTRADRVVLDSPKMQAQQDDQKKKNLKKGRKELQDHLGPIVALHGAHKVKIVDIQDGKRGYKIK